MMKQLAEEYLIELMTNFNQFGILDPDGKPFAPENFQAGENFDYEALKLFELGADQPINLADRNESHQNFYTLQCDNLEAALNADPLLKAAYHCENLGWVDTNTKNPNLYPIKALKAMWNHFLYPNKILNGNDWLHTKASNLMGLQPFLRYHAGYLDDTHTQDPLARYYGIPRIVDERTLTFSKSCSTLFQKILAIPDGMNALYAMLGKISNLIPKAYFDKMVANYKESDRELKVRIPQYEENLNRAPTTEEAESILTQLNELKNPAQLALDKYSPYFDFINSVKKQLKNFETTNPNASNEEKAEFYNSLLVQFRTFEEKAAPTPDEIEQDILNLQPQQQNLNIKVILGGDKPVYHLSADHLKAIYIALKATEILTKYKNDIGQAQLDLDEMKRQIQMKVDDVTTVGTIKKLISDKERALRAIQLLQDEIRGSQQANQQLNLSIDHEKSVLLELTETTSAKRAELAAPIEEQKKQLKKNSTKVNFYQEIIEDLERDWDQQIPFALFCSVKRILQWDDETFTQWQEKDNEYISWRESNANPPDNEGYLGTLRRNVSHYSHAALSTVANRTPRQQIIAEIQSLIAQIDHTYEFMQIDIEDKQGELDKLNAPCEKVLAEQRKLEEQAQELTQEILDKQLELDAQSRTIQTCNQQFASQIFQCTIKLNERISQSENELNRLQIKDSTISQLQTIFENTAKDLKKIKEEYDSILNEGNNHFISGEITSAKNQFDTIYRTYENSQLKLLESMISMADQLKKDYSHSAGENPSENQTNNHIIVLATQLKELALTYLPHDKTLDDKIKAKENFEKNCCQELYSNNIKTAVGAILGIVTTIILSAAVTAAIAVFFAGGGWLAFILGVPILAKAGAIATTTTLAIGGSLVGSVAGTQSDEKLSNAHFNQWRFFYEQVDKVVKDTSTNPELNLAKKPNSSNIDDVKTLESSALNDFATVLEAK